MQITPSELQARLANLVMARWNLVNGERGAVDIGLRGRLLVDADIRAIDDNGIKVVFDGFGEHYRFDQITDVAFYAMRGGDFTMSKAAFTVDAGRLAA